MKSRFISLLIHLVVLLAAPQGRAQELHIQYPKGAEPPPAPEPSITDIRGGRSFGKFAAGALTGFLAHEGGHLLMNLLLGNVPKFEPVLGFGFIPFFTIAPRIDCSDRDHCVSRDDGSPFSPGWRGKLAITSAGFHVQHITDEILLSRNPRLRYRVAPFQKGLLAFNTLLSVGYGLAAITRTENRAGDISQSSELMNLPREVFATMLLVPAALDLTRYFRPDWRWVPWVSRTGKVAVFSLIFVTP